MTENAAELAFNTDSNTNILNICSWNARNNFLWSLPPKSFLIKENIDVMLLAGTNGADEKKFNINGYKFYSTQHPNAKARGGTGIIIKCSIEHQELDAYKTEYLQATSINLNIGNENITLVAVYCVSYQAAKIREEQFMEFFDTLGDKFIACGDYNAKHKAWDSRTTVKRGKCLFSIINSNKNAFDFISRDYSIPNDRMINPIAIIRGINKNLLEVKIFSGTARPLGVIYYPVLLYLRNSPTAYLNNTNRLPQQQNDQLTQKQEATEHKRPASQKLQPSRCNSEEPGCSKRDRTQETIIGNDNNKKQKTSSTYNEGCFKTAIVDESSSDKKISPENWSLLENRLLLAMTETLKERPNMAPYFGNISDCAGFKILSCKSQETFGWLKDTVAGISELWDGAKLKVIPGKELPSWPKIHINVTGPEISKDRLQEMLRGQNKNVYPSDDWEIIEMDDSTPTGQSIIVAVNQLTIDLLEKNDSRISVGMTSVVARRVM